MLDVVWLIPAFPLAGFILLVLFGKRLGDPLAGWLATAMVAASFVVSVGVFASLLSRSGDDRQFEKVIFTWLPVGGLKVDVGFLADPLAVTMALFVTGVGALIHLYSIGYMHHDDKFHKFFIYMNLFAFSMLMLVLGNNLLVTFLGWEGVGVCSYFLISFWFTRESAARAGKKAFITNRVGDWGFMIAMFLLFQAIGSLNYLVVDAKAASISSTTATAIVLLFFVGAAGKSAQLPLYVWLPDAMEGPTPVSALIHAATMVTAGVFLMCRINPLIGQANSGAATVIAIIGALTALFAATIAIAQNDIKRVLAYSTVSQLGYMFLAVGSGAYVAAIFHMVTHAFFKALLFLGSGSVIHGLHDEQDMRRMGALRKLMPITAATFIVGWLAIAGVFPFAGFWSKDEILLFAWHKSPALWAVGLFTAMLTAFYMSRQVFLVFFGNPNWRESETHDAHQHDEQVHEGPRSVPHESPALMWIPLAALALLSFVGGAINLPFTSGTKLLEKWLDPVFGERASTWSASTAGTWIFALLSLAIALFGIAVAVYIYLQHRVDPARVERPVLANAWYVDRGYSAFFGGPGRAFADGCAWFDRTIIDGAVNGAAYVVRTGASTLRKAQSGYVRNYVLGLGAGAFGLLLWFLVKAGS